jgi:hypothetical protein
MIGRMSVVLKVALALLSSHMVGCKTTKSENLSDQNHGQGKSYEVTSGDRGWFSEVSLSEKSSRGIYLKMLDSELESGLAVAKDQTHSIKGLIRCQRNVDRDLCSMWIRKGENGDIYGEKSLDLLLSEEVSSVGRGFRNDLSLDKSLVMNVVCDYLGKNSPPFGLEKVDCKVQFPRGGDEAVLESPSAEKLVELLRSEQPFGDGKTEIQANLFCRFGSLPLRTECYTRTFDQAQSHEKISQLMKEDAIIVAQSLKMGLSDRSHLRLGASPSDLGTIEMNAQIKCMVDSRKFIENGERVFRCLVQF